MDTQWQMFKCKSGEVLFYYNVVTGEHRWTNGADMKRSDSVPGAASNTTQSCLENTSSMTQLKTISTQTDGPGNLEEADLENTTHSVGTETEKQVIKKTAVVSLLTDIITIFNNHDAYTSSGLFKEVPRVVKGTELRPVSEERLPVNRASTTLNSGLTSSTVELQTDHPMESLELEHTLSQNSLLRGSAPDSRGMVSMERNRGRNSTTQTYSMASLGRSTNTNTTPESHGMTSLGRSTNTNTTPESRGIATMGRSMNTNTTPESRGIASLDRSIDLNRTSEGRGMVSMDRSMARNSTPQSLSMVNMDSQGMASMGQNSTPQSRGTPVSMDNRKRKRSALNSIQRVERSEVERENQNTMDIAQITRNDFQEDLRPRDEGTEIEESPTLGHSTTHFLQSPLQVFEYREESMYSTPNVSLPAKRSVDLSDVVSDKDAAAISSDRRTPSMPKVICAWSESANQPERATEESRETNMSTHPNSLQSYSSGNLPTMVERRREITHNAPAALTTGISSINQESIQRYASGNTAVTDRGRELPRESAATAMPPAIPGTSSQESPPPYSADGSSSKPTDLASQLKASNKQESQNSPEVPDSNPPCTICGLRCSTLRDLTDHLKDHVREKNCCPLCDKKYATGQGLTYHLRSHSGERPYSCPNCSKTFLQPSAFSTHMRTHLRSSDYHSCDQCGEAFISDVALELHTATHVEENSHTCLRCGMTFKEYRLLSQHFENRQCPTSLHDCSVCDKKFDHYVELIQHMQVHEGETPFKCPECPKTFFRVNSLERHRKCHERRFICDHCGQGFKSSGALSEHLQQHK